MLEPLKDQPMRDPSRAIRFIRSRAGEFCIDPDRLVICGFSAGGHLCASVCVHFADISDEVYEGISNRPDAAILSYPVITSGDKAHQGSIQALLGADATEAELKYMFFGNTGDRKYAALLSVADCDGRGGSCGKQLSVRTGS